MLDAPCARARAPGRSIGAGQGSVGQRAAGLRCLTSRAPGLRAGWGACAAGAAGRFAGAALSSEAAAGHSRAGRPRAAAAGERADVLASFRHVARLFVSLRLSLQKQGLRVVGSASTGTELSAAAAGDESGVATAFFGLLLNINGTAWGM